MKKWKIFYFVTAIAGMILMALEVALFRKTIIPVYVLLVIILIVSTLTFLLTRKHLNRTQVSNGIFWPFMQNMLSWGFIAGYLFMAINYYGASKQSRQEQFKITSKSSLPGSAGSRHKRKPVVQINYSGFEKELVFRYKDTQHVEAAHLIAVTIRSGFFGYDVLDHYEAISINPDK